MLKLPQRMSSTSSWRVKWWKFVLRWQEATTATPKSRVYKVLKILIFFSKIPFYPKSRTKHFRKGPGRSTVLAGAGAMAGLLWYGLYGQQEGNGKGLFRIVFRLCPNSIFLSNSNSVEI